MKKKNIILKIVALSLTLVSVGLIASCSNSKTVNKDLNSASGSQAEVQKTEINKDISLDEAIGIALADAGVSRENAKFKETGLDSDDKIPHYDIEFSADNKIYDYEIAASEGKIIASTRKEFALDASNKPTQKSDETSGKKADSGYISVDEAKAFALKDAGIEKENANFKKAEFDSNDLVPHYDIEFYSDGYEYDYEIKAVDGTVLEKDKERERESKVTSKVKSNYISSEEAIEKALSHAGIKMADTKNVKTNLDADDIIVHYEVEFVSGQYEYEYEINAKSGNVIAAEKEKND